MDKQLKESMFQYYDERASEYDEIYLCGKLSTAINNPKAYIDETGKLKEIVNNFCSGNILDIPCGTGFWMQSYAEKCDSIILIDQSKNMLEESKQKASELGVLNKCEFIQRNVFNYDWPAEKFDTLLTGFFISHLSEEEEIIFLNRALKSLKAGGRILVLDSAWSNERASIRPGKEGKMTRRLNNGTEFDIYKKYYEPDDINQIGKRHNLEIEIHHCGITFFAFSGTVKK